MKNKFVGIIFIIAGLSLAGLFIYNQLKTPQQEQSQNNDQGMQMPSEDTKQEQDQNSTLPNVNIPSDWETFEDDILGYSIQHPSDWYTHKAVSYGSESAIESFNREENPGRGGVPSNQLKVAVRKFLPQSQIEYAPPSQKEILEERNITVAGIPATWRKIQSMGTNISVSFENQGSTYIISAYPSDSDYISEFEIMLKSFELIPAVTVSTPTPNSSISSPLQISGEAPGTWFFEASLSAQLQTLQKEVIAQTNLTTQESWMTEDLVNFSGTLEFENAEQEQNITLVIMGANPSGLPQNQKLIEIPVSISN